MNAILQDLSHPPTRHAMLVHLPIVLALLGIPLTLLGAILPKNLTLKWLALSLYLVLIVASFITSNSGVAAHDFARGIDRPEVYELIERHDKMGSNLWLFAAGTLALLALSAIKRPAISVPAAWLAVAGAAAASVWVGLVANLGGTLVYKYGVGTPNPVRSDQILGVQIDDQDHSAGSAATQSATTSPIANAAASTFELTVWPILEENCTKCHNPARVADGKSGRLDQTTRQTMLKGGRSGPAIVPGKPEESLLITLVKTHNVDDRMPPEPRDPLTAEQIAALERWIRDGAEWPVAGH